MATSDLPGDINQAKKRQRIDSFSDNQTPSATPLTEYSMPAIGRGMDLTAGQQVERARRVQRQAMGDRITNTRESVRGVIDNVAAGVKEAFSTSGKIATAPMRLAAGIGEEGITFDSNLPGQERRDRNRATEAKNFVRDNPEQAAAGQQYGQRIVDRTASAGVQNLSGPASQLAPAPSAEPRPGVANLMGQTRAQPSAPNPGSNPAISQPASRMFPDNAGSGEYGNVGYGGIVGRRNEEGVQEFSNMGSDQDASAGRKFSDPNSRVANGVGGLSIAGAGSGAEAMERNNRATEIMQQGRLERQNPNYATTIRDSGASGTQGRLNQTINKREARERAERSGEKQARVEAGRNRLADLENTRKDRRTEDRQMDLAEQRNRLGDELTMQKIAQGVRFGESEERTQGLQRVMSDPSASEDERNQAQRAFQALTVSGKNRFVTVQGGSDGQGGRDASKVFDTLTREFVEQVNDISNDRRAIEIRDDVNMTRAQKTEALRRLGYE